MEYQDNLKIVEKLLSKGEILCQLAEEAVELAKVIMLYNNERRRRWNGHCISNPFCESAQWKDVIEETADVSLVMTVALNTIYDDNERKIHINIMETMGVVVSALPSLELNKLIEKVCFDIAKTALKLRRAEGTENPTPITEEEAKKILLCHLSMMNSIIADRFSKEEKEDIKRIMMQKAERWSKRLRGEANA